MVKRESIEPHRVWYREKFGETRPEWYVFPFGKPRPNDPTRPITTFKTAWRNVRKNAKVTGRWRDNRHTLITDRAESGAGDQTIMDIADHVSKRMLRHYSHIRMDAKRTALESIVRRQTSGTEEQNGDSRTADETNGVGYPPRAHGRRNERGEKSEPKSECSELPTDMQHFEGDHPQKSPQSVNSEGNRGVGNARKDKKRNGS